MMLPHKMEMKLEHLTFFYKTMIRMVVVDSVDDYIESLRLDHLRSLVAACIFFGLKIHISFWANNACIFF